MTIILLLSLFFTSSTIIAEETREKACCTFDKVPCWIPRPRDKVNVTWWDLHERYANESRVKGDQVNIVFMGDSIIEAWQHEGSSIWKKEYLPKHAVNYGIPSDRTDHVLFRLLDGEMAHINPKLVVLMLGTNHGAENDFEEGIWTVVKTIKYLLPSAKTKILLLGVLPHDYFPGSQQRIAAANKKLKGWAESKHNKYLQVKFLDMTQDFSISPGKINKSLFHPGSVHLNEKGYRVWQAAMDKCCKKMF